MLAAYRITFSGSHCTRRDNWQVAGPRLIYGLRIIMDLPPLRGQIRNSSSHSDDTNDSGGGKYLMLQQSNSGSISSGRSSNKYSDDDYSVFSGSDQGSGDEGFFADGWVPVVVPSRGQASTSNHPTKTEQQQDGPSAVRSENQTADGVCAQQPYPPPTVHLTPAERLAALEKELQQPPRRVVLHFSQDDLYCLLESVKQLRLIKTWRAAPPAVLARLVSIVEQGEGLLRHAAVAAPNERSNAARVEAVQRACEEMFLLAASLTELRHQLAHNLSHEPLDQSTVMKLLYRTAEVLAASRGTAARIPQGAQAGPVPTSVAADVDANGRAATLDLWLATIGRLSLVTESNFVNPACRLVFEHVLHNEDMGSVIHIAHRLLHGAVSSEGMRFVLEELFSSPELRVVVSSDPDSFIDGIVLPFLGSNAACSSSPADRLTLMANFVADVLGNHEAALKTLVGRVDFQAFGSAAFPHALLVAFLQCSGRGNKAFLGGEGSRHGPGLSLLRCLAEQRKLGHVLNFTNVGQGCDTLFKQAFTVMLGGGPSAGEALDDVIRLYSAETANESGGSDAYRGFFSPLFVCHVAISIGSPVQAPYLAMLTLLASASTPDEQDALAVPSWLARDPLTRDREVLNAMHTSLCEVWSFFHDCTPSERRGHSSDKHVHAGVGRYSARLWDVVAARLRQMCADKQTGWSLETRVQKAVETMSHFVNIDKDHLAFLLQQNGKLDRFDSAIDAVLDTIDTYTVRRGGAHKWKTSDIPGMIFYYYCYAKYPVRDFERWVVDGLALTKVSDSVHQPTSSDVNAIFADFNSRRDRLCGRQEIADVGYKCMHYSQAFAVQVAIQQVEKNLNPFMRVGTGQGKSLIIALLAAHYAVKEKRRVYIFTCYKHLAQRDQKRFESFYKSLDVESAACGYNSKCPASTQVIYSDLHTFLYQRQTFAVEKCKEVQDRDVEDYIGMYQDSLDMVLLDEFDALVLMHEQVGNTVYHMQEAVTVGHPSPESLSSAESFKAAVAALNPGMEYEYWRRLSAAGLDEGVSAWLSGAGAWNHGHSGHDALGKSQTYIGGRLYELNQNGRFYGRPLATECLALLQSSRCVIGLSGSISPEEVGCFSDLFSRPPSYVEIPPYYGLTATRNRQISKQQNLSLTTWQDTVARDAAEAVKQGRPVLVFLHPDSPHWNTLEAKLQRLNNDNATVQTIKTEADVRDENLDRACLGKVVTLSSHVAGRGADFVVQSHIKRKGGLHVIVAFEPEIKGKLDVRMVDQMKGRTARMGAPGSFSIITTTSLPPHEVEKIDSKPAKVDAHQISTAVFLHVAGSSDAKAIHWKRYAFCMVFLDEMEKLPLGLEERLGDATGELRRGLGRDYIVAEIIGLPRFGPLLRREDEMDNRRAPGFHFGINRRENANQPHRIFRPPAPRSAFSDEPPSRGGNRGGLVGIVGVAFAAATSAMCSIQ